MASILILDDELGVQEFLREELEAQGHSVFCASSLKDGTKLLAKNKFDILLLDLHIPYETVKTWFKRKVSSLPVTLLLASQAMCEESAFCLKEGALLAIPKPVKINDLHSSIGVAIKEKSKRYFSAACAELAASDADAVATEQQSARPAIKTTAAAMDTPSDTPSNSLPALTPMVSSVPVAPSSKFTAASTQVLNGFDQSYSEFMKTARVLYIRHHLLESSGNLSLAARQMDIDRSSLYRLLNIAGISGREFKHKLHQYYVGAL